MTPTGGTGKIEMIMTTSTTKYTEPLGYVNMNLSLGQSDMESVATGIQNMVNALIENVTSSSMESCIISYEFNLADIIAQ